jgi:hypothetical protein
MAKQDCSLSHSPFVVDLTPFAWMTGGPLVLVMLQARTSQQTSLVLLVL